MGSEFAFVRHFREIAQACSPDLARDSIVFDDADFGRALGFARLGLHHIRLAPGARSSLPHAESTEEEFVYVLSGHPDLWMHGQLFTAAPGDAVAFLPGTGLAHTAINNSPLPVELFVVGERTRQDNRFYYPLHPERRTEFESTWWRDPPSPFALGPHLGLPGPRAKERLRERPSFLKNIDELERHGSFHYTGSEETFSEGIALSHKLGLRRLGVWHEILKPGKRTSWPHAHSKEEEFVYVISGEVELWVQGEIQNIKAGQGAAFLPGTGLAHTAINRASQPCELFVCGESQIEDDKIFYPLHPERNEECRQNGSLWEDHPQLPLGSASAEP
jgi:uncharacterized cupin superfamily protein